MDERDCQIPAPYLVSGSGGIQLLSITNPIDITTEMVSISCLLPPEISPDPVHPLIFPATVGIHLSLSIPGLFNSLCIHIFPGLLFGSGVADSADTSDDIPGGSETPLPEYEN